MADHLDHVDFQIIEMPIHQNQAEVNVLHIQHKAKHEDHSHLATQVIHIPDQLTIQIVQIQDHITPTQDIHKVGAGLKITNEDKTAVKEFHKELLLQTQHQHILWLKLQKKHQLHKTNTA